MGHDKTINQSCDNWVFQNWGILQKSFCLKETNQDQTDPREITRKSHTIWKKKWWVENGAWEQRKQAEDGAREIAGGSASCGTVF